MLADTIISHIKTSGILEKEKPLIVILGPTGSGKTAVSIPVAKELNGEIISADSRQVYRGMDIGTAKITPEEMEGVPHHLIDVVSPDETFSAGQFKTATEKAITEIYLRGNIPMIVGGTMLWIDGLVYNYQFPDETEFDETTQPSVEALQKELEKLDSKAFTSIDISNPRRLERAIAYFKETGESIVDAQTTDIAAYDVCMLGLRWEREVLYRRLNDRTDMQMLTGLLDETKTLNKTYDWSVPSMSGIGYKQIGMYLRGELSLDEAVEKLKTANRNYAKRQMTWWRKNRDIVWFDCNATLE